MSGYKLTIGGTEITATSSTPGVAVYNLTVNVVRATKTNTARGLTEALTTIVTNLPCEIIWLKGKEKIKFNKETHTLDGTLKCRVPAGVTIVESDRIVFNSETYRITNVEDVNNLGTLLEIGIVKDS
ncbi:hypothetical protein LCGC14_0737130 [marine sediment metagenome]|uniref:Uncharacterized protein n=1 Tax=marine sediment metagenome TaxID=412755 RepID=A0A0F9Q7S1_9ZZZZ